MCDSQSEAFKDMLAALESIVRNGTFFLSAIELDQYADKAIDGEEFERMIRAAIDKAHKEIGE